MIQFALDTSILLRWFSPYHDADVDRSLRLREEQQTEKIELAVLDLTLCELAHVLKEGNQFEHQAVDEAISSIEYMHVTIVPYSPALARRATQIAFEHDISVYEAGFVALGAALRCQAVTCDRVLYQKIANLPWTTLLGNMNI
ncbi:MAG: type II toxin-antitoxin system VapC family toxin [Candidatus Latescibacterota bacterium]|jgi:predicted nucleic acid-binding protein